MPELQVVVRYGVFSLFVLSALVALASWLVRTRRLSPFGPVGRALRGATEPVLRPVERRLVRLGGNPVHAGWWLVVVVAAGGVLLPSLLGWFSHPLDPAGRSVARGPAGAVAAPTQVAAWPLGAAPRARTTAVAGGPGDALRCRVAAPPVDGAASAELVRCLAERLGVSRSAVAIAAGAAGRRKTVEIAGLATDAAVRMLLEGRE